jgi:hypothetical protein
MMIHFSMRLNNNAQSEHFIYEGKEAWQGYNLTGFHSFS